MSALLRVSGQMSPKSSSAKPSHDDADDGQRSQKQEYTERNLAWDEEVVTRTCLISHLNW